MDDGMSDQECEQLLLLLARYIEAYPESASSGMGVADIAEDMAMSMDVTSDRADAARVLIEQAFKDHR